MTTILLYGHDKMYRDLTAGRTDKDARYDIAIEDGTRGLGANAKQKATMRKLGQGDFTLLIDEDGKLSVTTGPVARPKVPRLAPTDWLKSRLPSEDKRKAYLDFIVMLKERFPEASVVHNPEYLNYNANVTPIMLGLRIAVHDLTGAEFDAAVALAKEQKVAFYANYDNSCEPYLDFGGKVEFTWPLEVYYPQPDSKKPTPFQHYPIDARPGLSGDTRTSAKYRAVAAAKGPDFYRTEVLRALATKPVKGGWGGPWADDCRWVVHNARATRQMMKLLVEQGSVVVKMQKGKAVYHLAPNQEAS